MRECLRILVERHSSICRILECGWQDPGSVNALTLARVQLEGLYSMCMFTEDPRWVDIYVCEGWKKLYERFLLQREEKKKLERFESYSNTQAPNGLWKMAETIGILPEQIATIHKYQLKIPVPDGMSEKVIKRLATLGKAIQKLPQGSKKRMLQRLHFRYRYLCSFAHGSEDANLFTSIFQSNPTIPRSRSGETLKNTFKREIEAPTYTTSILSIIQSAAEIATLYPGEVELLVNLTKAWETMSDKSLLCKAIWTLRTRASLGILA